MPAWNFVRWLAGGLFAAALASGSAAAQDVASFYTPFTSQSEKLVGL